MIIKVYPPKDITPIGVSDLLRIIAVEIGKQQYIKRRGKVEYRGTKIATWHS